LKLCRGGLKIGCGGLKVKSVKWPTGNTRIMRNILTRTAVSEMLKHERQTPTTRLDRSSRQAEGHGGTVGSVEELDNRLTIGGVVIGGVAVIKWIFGKKGKEKRDEKVEGKSHRHAREWEWNGEDKDW
jgi:hypothetical protein